MKPLLVTHCKCSVINTDRRGMRGSRNFRQVGPGQSDKKKLRHRFFFFFFFLDLRLFYRNQMVNFKEINHFFKVSEGVKHFPGGSNFFQGGSNCLFPVETHITCDFPGGGVRTPCPPPWIRTCVGLPFLNQLH